MKSIGKSIVMLLLFLAFMISILPIVHILTKQTIAVSGVPVTMDKVTFQQTSKNAWEMPALQYVIDGETYFVERNLFQKLPSSNVDLIVDINNPSTVWIADSVISYVIPRLVFSCILVAIIVIAGLWFFKPIPS